MEEAKRCLRSTKIERCCVQAQLDGLQYVWIDSCCIDKTSSAEYVKPFFKFHFHSTIGVQFFPISCILLAIILHSLEVVASYFSFTQTILKFL